MLFVLQMAQANPFPKLNAIAAEVAGPDAAPVSRHAVRRRLAEAAIYSWLAVSKFSSTDPYRANRLMYAQDTLNQEDY